MQSKKFSLLESVVNVIVGFFISLISQIIIFAMYDVHFSLQTNMLMGLWFTIISIIRSYTLRRIFNKIKEK
jgi:hypothetical protein